MVCKTDNHRFKPCNAHGRFRPSDDPRPVEAERVGARAAGVGDVVGRRVVDPILSLVARLEQLEAYSIQRVIISLYIIICYSSLYDSIA